MTCGHGSVGDARAVERLLEGGNGVDVVVVVVGNPQPLDAANFALGQQLLQLLDDLGAAAVHHQGRSSSETSTQVVPKWRRHAGTGLPGRMGMWSGLPA